MSRVVRIAVPGAAGKMGRMVVAAIAETPGVALGAAVERAGHARLGEEAAPGIRIGDDLVAALSVTDVYIDFTAPASTVRLAEIAAERGVPAVIGTTGLADAEQAAVRRAATRVPVVQAANFSLGVNLLLGLVEQAARALPDFDLEIVELHHGQKRDAPSGTALALGQAGARGRGVELGPALKTGRAGEVGARPKGEIGVLAVRGGDVVGEHTVFLFGAGERIELGHRATTRAIFAHGAVRAAAWVVGRPAGLYSMKDVLGL